MLFAVAFCVPLLVPGARSCQDPTDSTCTCRRLVQILAACPDWLSPHVMPCMASDLPVFAAVPFQCIPDRLNVSRRSEAILTASGRDRHNAAAECHSVTSRNEGRVASQLRVTLPALPVLRFLALSSSVSFVHSEVCGSVSHTDG